MRGERTIFMADRASTVSTFAEWLAWREMQGWSLTSTVIKSGGEKVSALEVERELLEL